MLCSSKTKGALVALITGMVLCGNSAIAAASDRETCFFSRTAEASEKIAACTRVLDKTPDDILMLYTRARLQAFKMKNHSLAITDMERVVKLETSVTSIFDERVFLAGEYAIVGRHADAVTMYTLAFNGVGEYLNALTCQVESCDPSSPDHYFSRGQSYEKIGNMEAAKNDYRKAIEMGEIDPFLQEEQAKAALTRLR